MRFDDSEKKDKILPPLEKGDLVNIDFHPVEKQTSPPKHYTVETLNNYLKNPFREDKAAAAERVAQANEGEADNDEEDYRAIFEGLELGTEATRTGIIDNALHSQYINLNKDVYTIMPKGEYLIETLSLLGISMDKYKTSELGRALKKVYKGEMSIRQSLGLAEREIAAVFGTNGSVGQKSVGGDIGIYGEEVGTCPICGKTVKRDRFGYGCTGYKDGCKLRVPLSLCK
jgi:DNA topoisomerase-3